VSISRMTHEPDAMFILTRTFPELSTTSKPRRGGKAAGPNHGPCATLAVGVAAIRRGGHFISATVKRPGQAMDRTR
jgi:hypothetical protein